MKLLIDFLPGVLFLAALFVFDIYVATMVIMVAMALQIAVLLLLRKKVGGMQWFTLGVILLFGTATLILRDANFIKWKPTVINWMFAVALVIGPSLLKKNFIEMLMKDHLALPPHMWTRLNLAWAGVFVALGVANLWVAFNFSERTWGLFKVFGMSAVLMIFALAQILYLSQYVKQGEAPDS